MGFLDFCMENLKKMIAYGKDMCYISTLRINAFYIWI